MKGMFGLSEPEVKIVVDVLIKLGVSALLGGLVGWEREVHGRPAGIRTHMLLIIGVVLFTEASKYFAHSEASRVAAQVVVGVGFLGAGTIIRTGGEIRGLTTAASIWATAGIGMAVSLGGAFMAIAVLATVLALFTLIVVDVLEHRFLHTKQPKGMRLKIDDQNQAFALLEHLSAQHDVQIRSVEVVQAAPDVVLDLEVRGATQGLLEKVLAHQGVRSAAWHNH